MSRRIPIADSFTRATALSAAAVGTGLTADQVTKTLRPMYDQIMPRATKTTSSDHRPPTPLSTEIARVAGCDLADLGNAGTIRWHDGLQPALWHAVVAGASALVPAARAVVTVSASLRREVIAAQDRMIGRRTSAGERDNVRTRSTTAVKDVVVGLITEDPSLLRQETFLVERTTAAVRHSIEAADAVWGVSWVKDRRRENGTEPPAVALTDAERRLFAGWARALRPALVRSARRFDPALAEDIAQETLLHVYRQRFDSETDMRRAAFAQLRRSYHDMVGSRAYVRLDTVDWSDRTVDGGRTIEERTFGASERESRARAEDLDDRLDAERRVRELRRRARPVAARRSSALQPA